MVEITLTLQQEPKKFIDEYLKGGGAGGRSPAYKDILFGFDDVQLDGWSASCGPADSPAKYAIAISSATFLQQYLALDRLLTATTIISASAPIDRSSQKLQFLQIVNGEFQYLFDGDPRAPSSLGLSGGEHSLMRQLMVYCPVFLFLHELCHIEDGHLAYRAEQRLARKYWQLEQVREARAKDSRAMEFLADSSAILTGASMVVSSLADKPLTEKISHLKQFGFAVGLNLLLADIADWYPSRPRTLTDPKLNDHPNAGTRLVWCQYIFSDGMFKGMWPETLQANTPAKDAKEAIKAGIDQTVRAWTKLGWKRSAADVDDPALGPYMFEISRQLESPPEFRQPENPNQPVTEVTKL
ncbi:hypothetical protein BSZ21_05820 [Bradyrhizobium canariense]|nr:hypothetical protein BSZ21_05820 [Bradyrhizobium canariense]